MEEVNFAVIAEHDGQLVWDTTRMNVPEAKSLTGLITWFVEQGCVPLSWSMELPYYQGEGKSHQLIHSESIAAGHVIDFVDGKYIARGTPEANAEEAQAIQHKDCGINWYGAGIERLKRLRTLEVADRNCAMRPSDEIPPAPLPVEKVGGFDAFKGWAPVFSGSVSQPQPLGLPSSDLQRASHQVHYEHGSADLKFSRR